ncbi:MAG: rRNA pseudouridine synthase [Ruminococcaceae bacterium]|nr:rRNA pseudouridine synthase [Oscillospiraceae bacterium]
MKKELVRLQKMLADCGVDSRRKCEELIKKGQVKVNGKVAVIGDKVDPYSDKVYVKGKRVTAAAKPKYRYIMLNKPRGYVTTMNDERGRKCIAELIEDIEERVYPIGRLDRDSEGMLLLTNDGDFANHIMHPKKHINKVYRVTVRPSINEEQVEKLQTGIVLDGRKTAPAQVRVVTKQEGRVVLEIVLREGRNRQIRRMCESLGLEVARLKRIAVGTVKLGGLKQGMYRDLSADEVKRLSHDPNPTKNSR